MLADEAEITVAGGHGGAGRVSFHSKTRGGPDGGDGGRGGNVYVKATTDIYALNQFPAKKVYKAENGQMGGSHTSFGAAGKDLILTMPVGTVLTDQEGNEDQLNEIDQIILLAKGGLGGRGNASFKSPSNTTPKYAQSGLSGQEKKLIIKLKLIADFGLIGLPNAGKSSLLNEITNAQAKIGDYPFTTLEPNLGVLPSRHPEPFASLEGKLREGSKILADIPGLIEGASEGKGLGHKFLKHIEKVHLLLHCISVQSEYPLKDYEIVRGELKKYNGELPKKKEIILLTKSDLVEIPDLEKKLKKLTETKKKVLAVSIHDWDSLQSLIKILI